MTISKNTVIITGATGAIGSAVTKECLSRRYNCILVVRNKDKALKLFGTQNVDIVVADFKDVNTVKRAAEEISRTFEVDSVINCIAGGMSPKRVLLKDNIEEGFAISCLSPYLFSKLLCDLQLGKRLSRIFTITTLEKKSIDFENIQAEKKYSLLDRWHQHSALKNTFMMALANKYKDADLSVVLYAPGFVKHDKAFRGPGLMKIPLGIIELLFAGNGIKGAKQLAQYLEESNLKHLSGKLLYIDKEMRLPDHYLDKDIQKRLITESEKMIQLLSN